VGRGQSPGRPGLSRPARFISVTNPDRPRAPALTARPLLKLVARLPELLDHRPRPSLLHGALWSGNHGMLPDGSPDVLFAGDMRVSGDRRDLVPDGQHLTCFAGGMYALGGRLLSNEDHVAIGAQLARGCGWAYASFPTGVMPEIFGLIPCGGGGSLEPCAWDEGRWHREGGRKLPQGFKHARDTRYILRPEAIESIFIMYRLTGDREWQEMAWAMFEAIKAVTTTEVANAAIKDVRDPESPKMDSMEVSQGISGLTVE
jgi:hypothetical protein